MNSNQIRKRFVDFFAANGHTVVPSSSLIPIDPTLLLTVAGMVPFKSYLLGEETPPYPRAVSIQKCARTADIDIVGTTARHLTFFEMLGNFSFGDYFKEKAIPFAYEFITEHLEIDPGRLWYTVYKDDDEAAEIWIDGVGVPSDRVQRGDKDNFWQMGVAGPCGPSSEIFVVRGAQYGEDGGAIGGDEDRFVEVWNLVFMQHVQDEPYHVVGDLPAKNIDTGAGLDRLAMVLQDTDSLFTTDLIRPMVAVGERLTGVSYGAHHKSDVSLRIIGDHGRAITFLVADGVVPSNEGRGYVLRRLLRRAVRHAYLLGASDLVVPTLVSTTAEIMEEAYPDLLKKLDFIADMTEREEVKFRKTLESGQALLDVELADLDPGAEVSGETAFKLHDTYGFPVEVTEEIVEERGYVLNRSEFETMMAAQRDRARAAWKGGTESDQGDVYRTLLRGADPSEFVGYEDDDSHGVILSMIREGETVERVEEGQEVEVFLDRTPFYAESGGQVGDSGTIETETGAVRIKDTLFALPGVHGHRGAVVHGFVQTGQDASARIDTARRERLSKNHTGTHVLHSALRDVIGEHVHQAGSLVAPERLRFDFSHFAGLGAEELGEIEQLANARIIENDEVHTIVTSKDKAEEMGALAFFGDKYGEQVRVVRTGGYSTEFCGGTHVPSTGQVGPLILLTEGSIGSNLRRVEALTGNLAYEFLAEVRRTLDGVANIVRAGGGDVLNAARAMAESNRELAARVEQFEDQTRSQAAATMLESAEQHGDFRVLVASRDGLPSDELRALVLQIRSRLGEGIGVVGTSYEGKGSLIAFVTEALAERGVSAGELIAPAARILGGGGGRDPQLAQAGGPHGDRIAEALEDAGDAARRAVAGA